MFNFLRNLFKPYDDGIKVKIIDLPGKQRSVFDILKDPPTLSNSSYIVIVSTIDEQAEFYKFAVGKVGHDKCSNGVGNYIWLYNIGQHVYYELKEKFPSAKFFKEMK